MGGKLVLLTFASVEDMTSMLEEAGLCWLRNWFEDVKRWSPNLKLDNKRADCVNKDRGFRSSVVEDSEDYECAHEKGEDVDVSGIKEDTFAIANKDDQAKLSNPLGINQISESSIHVEEYKEASQAEGNTFKDVAGTVFPTFSGKDVVSACDETPSCVDIQDVEVDPLLSRPPLFASDDSISVSNGMALPNLHFLGKFFNKLPLSGGVVAGVLAKAGHKVLVLEKGSYSGRTKLSLLEGPTMDQMYMGNGLLATEDMGAVILAGATVGGGSTVNWSASIQLADCHRNSLLKDISIDWIRKSSSSSFT
ncbi:hypothetical protein Vadar_019622 [Vaccinium darrowii]|uniref:Uncharacterized protein n=1 Tax=Vaccinium darrowii TaxID=229202 RepID=A0ACB7XIU5_9ERIC|nr:hypothetical protein Vadar_019622 [Vaccinium darrowii]